MVGIAILPDSRIVRATINDVYTLADLHLELNQEMAAHSVFCPEELLEWRTVEHLIRHNLGAEGFLVWLARTHQEGDGVGFVSAALDRAPMPTARLITGTILNLYVKPASRRSGVGSALFQTARTAMTAAGARAIELSYLNGNERAARFWSAQGFVPESTKAVLPLSGPR